MSIEIANPRRVAVALRGTTKGAEYRVDKLLRSFLERRGWKLQKLGRSYVTMTPPVGVKAPFVFELDIPTREQVMVLAQHRHITKGPWAGKLGEWVALYSPPRSSTSQHINSFTALPISKPKT